MKYSLIIYLSLILGIIGVIPAMEREQSEAEQLAEIELRLQRHERDFADLERQGLLPNGFRAQLEELRAVRNSLQWSQNQRMLMADLPSFSEAEKCPRKTNYKFDEKETDCTICLDKICGGHEYTLLPCQHPLHFQCFRDLVIQSNQLQCPSCRQHITHDDGKKLGLTPSGVIPGQSEQVGLFDRFKSAFKGKSDPVVLEKKITELEKNLADTQKRYKELEQQKNVAEKKKIDLEHHFNVAEQDWKTREIKLNKTFEEFKLLHPELVQIDHYKHALDQATNEFENYKKEIEKYKKEKRDLENAMDLQRRDYERRNDFLFNQKYHAEANNRQLKDCLKQSFDFMHDEFEKQFKIGKAGCYGGSLLTAAGVGYGTYMLLKKFKLPKPELGVAAGILTGRLLLKTSTDYLQNRHNDLLSQLAALENNAKSLDSRYNY